MGFMIALAAALTLATAQDEPLPQSVVDPYLAYQAAVEAQDWETASSAAHEAWRAADRENVDRATRGQLAANYGQIVLALGQYDAAYEAWRDAAELADRTGQSDTVKAWRWHHAALSALGRGDVRDAQQCSRRAVRAARGAENFPQEVAGEPFFLLARANAQAGRLRGIGVPAREAIEAFQESGRAVDRTYADAYYLSGLDRFFFGEKDRAGEDFHMALGMFDALGETYEEEARTTSYWIRLTLSELRGFEEEELIAFAEASPYPWDVYRESTAGLSAGFNPDDDPSRVDVELINRPGMDYPSDAARAGLEGIVLAVFAVDSDGRVADVEFPAAAPNGVFEDDIREAMEDWDYAPATVDGEPVRREGLVTEFIFQFCDPGEDCDRESGDRGD